MLQWIENQSEQLQSNINELMNELIIGITIFLVTALLALLGNKYFLKRPKITLTIKENYSNSSASNIPQKIKIQWNKYFVIKNLTKSSAYNIRFYNQPKNIVLKNNDTVNLEGFKEAQISFSFVEDIEKEKVISVKNRFVDLLPNYYKELSFGLEYENEHNKKFYTYFQKRNDLEQNKFYFCKAYK